MNSPFQNSAIRADPYTRIYSYCSRWQYNRLELSCIVQSTSNIKLVLSFKKKKKKRYRRRRSENQVAVISLLLSERRQAKRRICFLIFKRYSWEKKNCSVTSYKWIFMCTSSYEEAFCKTKGGNINIWYLKAFFSIPLFYFWRHKRNN